MVGWIQCAMDTCLYWFMATIPLQLFWQMTYFNQFQGFIAVVQTHLCWLSHCSSLGLQSSQYHCKYKNKWCVNTNQKTKVFTETNMPYAWWYWTYTGCLNFRTSCQVLWVILGHTVEDLGSRSSRVMVSKGQGKHVW